MNGTTPVKLNLGCGLQCPEGWVNIDSSLGVKLAKRPVLRKILHAIVPASWGVLPNAKWPANARWMDITRRFPYADNSVDAVYSSHTIEHLTYEEGAFVFRECHRILKPGGAIRIIVPDLDVMVNNYLAQKKFKPQLAAKKFLEDTFYFEIPIPKSLPGMIKFYFKRKNNHHFLYDQHGLRFQMEISGFTEVELRPWGNSRIENIDKIDIPERFTGSICLEGIKR